MLLSKPLETGRTKKLIDNNPQALWLMAPVIRVPLEGSRLLREL
jgi:hypothetical protein